MKKIAFAALIVLGSHAISAHAEISYEHYNIASIEQINKIRDRYKQLYDKNLLLPDDLNAMSHDVDAATKSDEKAIRTFIEEHALDELETRSLLVKIDFTRIRMKHLEQCDKDLYCNLMLTLDEATELRKTMESLNDKKPVVTPASTRTINLIDYNDEDKRYLAQECAHTYYCKNVPITVYVARLSKEDHINSAGNISENLSEILMQDRTNFYKAIKRDPEDTGDKYFLNASNRTEWPYDCSNLGTVDAHDIRNKIFYDTPLVRVLVYREFYRGIQDKICSRVTLVDQDGSQKPSPQANKYPFDNGADELQEIKALDDKLNALWKDIKSQLTSDEFSTVQIAQRRWLKERDACGPDNACIKEKYERRLRLLESLIGTQPMREFSLSDKDSKDRRANSSTVIQPKRDVSINELSQEEAKRQYELEERDAEEEAKKDYELELKKYELERDAYYKAKQAQFGQRQEAQTELRMKLEEEMRAKEAARIRQTEKQGKSVEQR